MRLLIFSMLWENRDLTVQPVIIFICVGEFMHPVYLIFQSVLLKKDRN